MPSRALRVGDRVRVVRLPPIWATPGYLVPADTRRIYRLMINRRRAVRVCDVDKWGAWVHLVVRSPRGPIHYYFVTLDDGSWVRLVPRARHVG